MYYKRSTGTVFARKTILDPDWVKWVHHSQGSNCCQECLKLDGCFFLKDKAPFWPHHPNCHCTLESVDYTTVVQMAIAQSNYSKFDPYLFNTTGLYTHTKEKLFAQWGYTVDDAKWLQAEMERQGREMYLAGEYTLGMLNDKGQRISIRVTIPRKDNGEPVSFITGWMVYPNGFIQLTTPYGGK